ncbi:NAD-dependent epimerase/dehydratase family protein [Paenibacillus sp.]|uniref:NAD-dependent epimerase/dehydratase family protein n=1 Tax=Paenibacillus sp. TaxID=58172 RepID=UPI00282678DF|nr:NAD-dependent epimerase/dehydratase family protein [Paenibacillus sp.]MDR0267487.1 NAD-dependent epimerase/dehydratase family protein [Paenibacillus sp.]
MANILVTGGTGFIGFHLVKHLLKEGHRVTIIDNLFRSKLDNDYEEFAHRIRFIKADLTQPLTELKLEQSYDHVFHLAAINGVKYADQTPERVLRTNLLSTLNIMDWCARHPPKTVVFSSSSEAYHGAMDWFDLPLPTSEKVPLVVSDPSIPRYSYGASKIIGEVLTMNYAKAYGFKARIVRYHNIYGPRMGYDHVIPELIGRIQKGEKPFTLYGPDQTRAFCFVSDAVRATYEIGILNSGDHHIVNIGNSNQEIKVRELCKQLFAVTDYEAELYEVPAPSGSPDRRCPDTSLLQQLIQYQPEVSLEEGLKMTVEWYQSNKAES